MRLQLALNVRNLDDAIDFYSRMFGSPPAKTKPGYANFAIEQPPLKLVLFEQPDAPDDDFHHLNHLGVEVEEAAQVRDADARLSDDGLATTGVENATCCFAEKTETWVESPEGARWEWYVKNGDADQIEHRSHGAAAAPVADCC